MTRRRLNWDRDGRRPTTWPLRGRLRTGNGEQAQVFIFRCMLEHHYYCFTLLCRTESGARPASPQSLVPQEERRGRLKAFKESPPSGRFLLQTNINIELGGRGRRRRRRRRTVNKPFSRRVEFGGVSRVNNKYTTPLNRTVRQQLHAVQTGELQCGQIGRH